MKIFPNWNFFSIYMNALSYLIRPLSTSWWSVWPPRILFFSVLKKLLCSKKHLLLFTVTAGRANVVFKTHEPWSPSLFPVQRQRNATDFWILHHTSQWPLCFPFYFHAALKNTALYLLAQKLWLKTDNQHFKNPNPLPSIPKCPGGVQLQKGGKQSEKQII